MTTSIRQSISRFFTLRPLLLAIALISQSCASQSGYWETNAEWSAFRPAQINVIERDDPSIDCGAAPRSVLGCAVRHREASDCTVFIRAQLPRSAYTCVVRHETRHCVGDDHVRFDKRPHYAVDCGDGELYSGPSSAAGS